MNQQALRFEGIVAARTSRAVDSNVSRCTPHSDPEVVYPSVTEMCTQTSPKDPEASARAASPDLIAKLTKSSPMMALSVDATDAGGSSSNTTSNFRLRIRPDKEVDMLVDELIGGKRKDNVVNKAFSFLERCIDWWMELREPEREGRMAKLVDSRWFECFCGLVIACNCAVTVHTTNYEAQSLKEDKSVVMKLLNIGFVAFYALELVMKLRVHRLYFFCNAEMGWNLFDLVLVCMAVCDKFVAAVETSDSVSISHMRTMRIVRLAKILRMVRMMRFFQELRLMLNSLVGSMVSLFWSIVMLSLVFLVFALIFVQGATITLMDDNGDLTADDRQLLISRLGSMEKGILALYQTTTGGEDWNLFYRSIQHTGELNCTLFLFFVAFAQFALLNILTGIYVENAMKLAQPDREKLAVSRRKAEITEAGELRRLFKSMDVSKKGCISEEQFMRQLNNANFKARLSLLGLDIKDAELFFKIIASNFDHHEVAIEAFVSGAMRLKGNASALDLQTLTFGTKLIHANQIQFHKDVDKRLEELTRALKHRSES